MSVTGYVLGGGKSSRFGSDKARAVLRGVPLIVRVAETLRLNCNEVVAVADNVDKYADLGLSTIADLQPGKGPLAGLEAALSHQINRQGEGWIILASCDMAGLKAAWVEEIHRKIAAADAAVAIAFRGDFWQPFPAAFHTKLLPTVRAVTGSDRASFQQLFSRAEAQALALTMPDDWPPMPQVNTPADLASFDRASG